MNFSVRSFTAHPGHASGTWNGTRPTLPKPTTYGTIMYLWIA
ncbi:unnamed protein product, partial [Rhizoctonia solani]